MEQIEVLIAEDHDLQREWLWESLSRYPEIRLVGAAKDGVEALGMVIQLKPRVLVLDMVMPKMDGYALLEELQHIAGIPHPLVIAMTSLNRGDHIRKALGMCVSYYMVKPVEPSLLALRIIEAARGTLWADKAEAPEPQLEGLVRGALVLIGVPANLTGYRCIRAALMLISENPALLHGMSRMLYPRIANTFGMSAEGVERAIRHAITQTWIRGGAERYRSLLGRRASTVGEKPTNGEFLAQVSECLRLQMSGRRGEHEKSIPDFSR